MSTQTTFFHFRLGRGQSIGPRALQSLWAMAAGSSEVSVSRQGREAFSEGHSHIYALHGAAAIGTIPDLEARLRRAIDRAMPGASVITRVY